MAKSRDNIEYALQYLERALKVEPPEDGPATTRYWTTRYWIKQAIDVLDTNSVRRKRLAQKDRGLSEYRAVTRRRG